MKMKDYETLRTELNLKLGEVQNLLLELKGIGSTINITSISPSQIKLYELKQKVEK